MKEEDQENESRDPSRKRKVPRYPRYDLSMKHLLWCLCLCSGSKQCQLLQRLVFPQKIEEAGDVEEKLPRISGIPPRVTEVCNISQDQMPECAID